MHSYYGVVCEPRHNSYSFLPSRFFVLSIVVASYSTWYNRILRY